MCCRQEEELVSKSWEWKSCYMSQLVTIFIHIKILDTHFQYCFVRISVDSSDTLFNNLEFYLYLHYRGWNRAKNYSFHRCCSSKDWQRNQWVEWKIESVQRCYPTNEGWNSKARTARNWGTRTEYSTNCCTVRESRLVLSSASSEALVFANNQGVCESLVSQIHRYFLFWLQ